MANNLKKIQQIAAAMNEGKEISGICVYRLGTASNNQNPTEEHQVFTTGQSPRRIGSVGKIGGQGQFVPFEHIENGSLVCSL